MAYVGVEFLENGGIGLIHSSWLTPLKKEAFWPPYKSSNLFNKALSTQEEPDQSSWKLYPIKRLFFECDNLERANKKFKKCEDTSDILSSESDLDSRLVRKRKSTKRYLSDCSSSENDESLGKLPRPPIFPKVGKHNLGGSSSQRIFTDTPTRSTTDIPEDITIFNRTFSNNLPPTIYKNPLSKPHAPKENFSVSSPSVCENEDLTLTPNKKPVLTESNRTITVSANGLEKIFKEVRKLREELKEVKGLLKQSRNSCVISSLPNDIPVEFPLSNIANFQSLDEYLNSEQDKINDLASFFSTFGGNGTNAQVNKILRFVMSDLLATRFNFAGQRDKQAFGGTKLSSVIIRAIQIISPSTTNAAIETAIKTWLKHAKQRTEKKQKSTRE